MYYPQPSLPSGSDASMSNLPSDGILAADEVTQEIGYRVSVYWCLQPYSARPAASPVLTSAPRCQATNVLQSE